MTSSHLLAGVYAAALTPLHFDHPGPDLEAFPPLLDFLARRGCHGALLLGTTGEGPSFAPTERQALARAAVQVRRTHPGFRLLLGSGTPSLEETIQITQAAFDAGLDGVVTLPPYYFRKVSDEGLFEWFSQVMRRAVPGDGYLLGYHIPPVSGVGLSLDLLARIKDAFPDQFAGIKDSSGDPQQAEALDQRFGEDLLVLTGNDRLFTRALECHAGGCITALATLCSPDLRRVWDTFGSGTPDGEAQERLNAARAVMDRYPPAPPLLKALLARQHGFPLWPVRPPLLPLSTALADQAYREMTSALLCG